MEDIGSKIILNCEWHERKLFEKLSSCEWNLVRHENFLECLHDVACRVLIFYKKKNILYDVVGNETWGECINLSHNVGSNETLQLSGIKRRFQFFLSKKAFRHKLANFKSPSSSNQIFKSKLWMDRNRFPSLKSITLTISQKCSNYFLHFNCHKIQVL